LRGLNAATTGFVSWENDGIREHRPTSADAASHPTIAATATALPPHTITRDDVKYYMGRVFDIPERKLEAMMSIVDNAQVHKRHSIFRLITR